VAPRRVEQDRADHRRGGSDRLGDALQLNRCVARCTARVEDDIGQIEQALA